MSADNDWFFERFSQPEQHNVFGSLDWTSLSEEQRYAYWSLHLAAGGKEMTFFSFCDLMDEVTK